MKRHQPKRFGPAVLTVWFTIVGCLLTGTETVSAQDGLERLMHRAGLSGNDGYPGDEPATESPQAISKTLNFDGSQNAWLIPNTLETADGIRRTAHVSQDGVASSDDGGFAPRNNDALPNDVSPPPVGYGKPVYGEPKGTPGSKLSSPGYNLWNPNAGRDEFVFDGSDRGEKVRVDQSWNIYGLETEDTIGHFDTLDGRRLVTPSNRVAIYAPRFGAVRKIDGVFKAQLNQQTSAFGKKLPIAQADGNNQSSTTKQHLALNRFEGASRASGFLDQTRGVVSDSVTHLFGVRNRFEPFENLSLIRYGEFSKAESARLGMGIQSALAWEGNLGLQVVVKKARPIIVKDVSTVQQLISVESEDGDAILRVTKIASKIAAQAGEDVDFTIRFDNLSNKKIGNVTIIDNLTRRLEYVPNSAECSLKADFVNQQNDVESLMLRWEITDPIEPHQGGIIRFKCRVR
jgi:uncharacterized repeat protein (TIGR01451 family)